MPKVAQPIDQCLRVCTIRRCTAVGDGPISELLAIPYYRSLVLPSRATVCRSDIARDLLRDSLSARRARFLGPLSRATPDGFLDRAEEWVPCRCL